MYLWRCDTIWELQERYIKHVAQLPQPSDFLPSPQFRRAVKMAACKGTNHFLAYHLLAVSRPPYGRHLSWTTCSVAEANNDELEGTHSAGRARKGNDTNFDVAQWLDMLTGLETLSDLKRMLEKEGHTFGAPKNTKATHQCRITSLGQFEDDNDFAKSLFAYYPPQAYKDFMNDMLEAREKGIAWGRERYIAAFGEACREQFIEAGQWEVNEYVVPEHLTINATKMMSQRTDLAEDATPTAVTNMRVRHVCAHPPPT